MHQVHWDGKKPMSPENGHETERDRIGREVEALLFASDEPLSLARISALLGGSSKRMLKESIDSLNGFYREHDRSFEVVEVAGGYQMATLPEFASTVVQLFANRRKARLSKPALETLAIIVYKQPISRLDIEQIRGVNCDGVLATLVERGLIEVTGRGEGLGKPFLYSTTKKFLEYLGLKDHRDLPSIEEIERSLESTDLAPRPLVPMPSEATAGGEVSGGDSPVVQEGSEDRSQEE
jgi:segregation and condensation protein B